MQPAVGQLKSAIMATILVEINLIQTVLNNKSGDTILKCANGLNKLGRETQIYSL